MDPNHYGMSNNFISLLYTMPKKNPSNDDFLFSPGENRGSDWRNIKLAPEYKPVEKLPKNTDSTKFKVANTGTLWRGGVDPNEPRPPPRPRHPQNVRSDITSLEAARNFERERIAAATRLRIEQLRSRSRNQSGGRSRGRSHVKHRKTKKNKNKK